MTKFEIFKEKLKICWKLWKANQYFFASYRGDMGIAFFDPQYYKQAYIVNF